METIVIDRQRGRRVSRAGFSPFLRRLTRELPAEDCASLAVCLVSDRAMRRFNRQFRGSDASTDVLAFSGEGEPDEAGLVHLGDIVISVPTAARQAREAGHSLARELRILALHGYLHLLGYDHETDDGSMRRLQARMLRRLSSPARRS